MWRVSKRKRRNGSDGGPLRDVVGYTDNEKFPALKMEVLECGHVVSANYNRRRRCWKCKRGAPVDVQPADQK